MITTMITYEIDQRKVPDFERFAIGWIPIVKRFGGQHHGCFLPSEGASDVAYVLFSFPSLADYEFFRDAFPEQPEAKELMRISSESACIKRWDRTFLRPSFGGEPQS